MSLDPVIPYERTFDGLYGLQIDMDSVSEEEVRATVPVRDEIKQPMGLVHGGVFASIAESRASLGAGVAGGREGKQARGRSSATSFMGRIPGGTVHGVARRIHRGRTTWIW